MNFSISASFYIVSILFFLDKSEAIDDDAFECVDQNLEIETSLVKSVLVDCLHDVKSSTLSKPKDVVTGTIQQMNSQKHWNNLLAEQVLRCTKEKYVREKVDSLVKSFDEDSVLKTVKNYLEFTEKSLINASEMPKFINALLAPERANENLKTAVVGLPREKRKILSLFVIYLNKLSSQQGCSVTNKELAIVYAPISIGGFLPGIRDEFNKVNVKVFEKLLDLPAKFWKETFLASLPRPEDKSASDPSSSNVDKNERIQSLISKLSSLLTFHTCVHKLKGVVIRDKYVVNPKGFGDSRKRRNPFAKSTHGSFKMSKCSELY